jgi:DNA-binding MarR family transcriptional regulator
MIAAAQMWKLNHRLLTQVMNNCVPQLEELGLETKEFFVLDEVDACKYPAELAARLMLPKASVTLYLRSLVAKGFIRREIDAADLRRHRLITTEAGRATLSKALTALSAEFDRMLGRLRPEEQGELQRLLLKVLDGA